MTPNVAAKPGGLKGVHVLAIILLFFSAVIGINAYFVVHAITSFPGEDEPRSYAQGLQYNTTLADRARQEKLGWRAEAWLAPGKAGGARVAVKLTTREGVSLRALSVTGVLRRPVDSKEDLPLAFFAAGDGVYVANITALAPGQWSLHAVARGDRAFFDLRKTLLWPTPQP